MTRSQSADLRELHRSAIPLCTAVLGSVLFHGGETLIHGAWRTVPIDLALAAVTAAIIVLYVRGLRSERSRLAVGVAIAILVILIAAMLSLSMRVLTPGLFSFPLAVISIVLMVAVAIAVFRLMYVLAVEGDG